MCTSLWKNSTYLFLLRQAPTRADHPDPAWQGSRVARYQILGAVGFHPTFRYQKYRETWVSEGAEIVIDETPVGTFLEIEGTPAAIHRTAAALGYARGDYITDSYVGLFLAAGGRGDMVFS